MARIARAFHREGLEKELPFVFRLGAVRWHLGQQLSEKRVACLDDHIKVAAGDTPRQCAAISDAMAGRIAAIEQPVRSSQLLGNLMDNTNRSTLALIEWGNHPVHLLG